VAGCCECGDESSGSCVTELVIDSFSGFVFLTQFYFCFGSYMLIHHWRSVFTTFGKIDCYGTRLKLPVIENVSF
jgi:hypothetical protein